MLFLLLLGIGVVPIAAAQQEGIIAFPLKASPRRSPLFGKRGANGRRQFSVDTAGELLATAYTIDIVVGTPGQTTSVEFDTGSDELWVNPDCATANSQAVCEAVGQVTQSSTYVDLLVESGKNYIEGYAFWSYGFDVVTIGEAALQSQIFGKAFESAGVSVGHMGMAPSLYGWESSYPYVIDTLYYQGHIRSRAFSLDIRAVGDPHGSVVFGGIDTARYVGTLQKLSIVQAGASPDGYTRYWIQATGLVVRRPVGGREEVTDVFSGMETFSIDSSYALCGLPGPHFEQLLQAFPSAAPTVPGSSTYAVDCNDEGVEGFLDFKFGSKTISVPFKDFIIQQDDVCVLGAFPSDSYPVLGQAFLRAAYVVFDWDNREIHLGNSAAVVCDSSLVVIESGPNAVPNLPGSCPDPDPEPTPPDDTPVQTPPIDTPVVTPPVVTPPVVTPPIETPGETPGETPIGTPVDTPPVDTPVVTPPVETPIVVPPVDTPIETPIETPPVEPPAETPPVDTPVATPPTDEGTSSTTSATSTSRATSSRTASTSSTQTTTDSLTSTQKHPPGPGFTGMYPTTYTSIQTFTETYSVTSCPPEIHYCPTGQITTRVTTRVVTTCPQVTATYIAPPYCPGKTVCESDDTDRMMTVTYGTRPTPIAEKNENGPGEDTTGEEPSEEHSVPQSEATSLQPIAPTASAEHQTSIANGSHPGNGEGVQENESGAQTPTNTNPPKHEPSEPGAPSPANPIATGAGGRLTPHCFVLLLTMGFSILMW